MNNTTLTSKTVADKLRECLEAANGFGNTTFAPVPIDTVTQVIEALETSVGDKVRRSMQWDWATLDKDTLGQIQHSLRLALSSTPETPAVLLACEGCGTIGNGTRRCCLDQRMIDTQALIHRLWDLAYPTRAHAAKASAPLCQCGHDGRPGPGHQTNCPQWRAASEGDQR